MKERQGYLSQANLTEIIYDELLYSKSNHKIQFTYLFFLFSISFLFLTVIEDDCQFLGVHIRLLTRYKICFTHGLFAI